MVGKRHGEAFAKGGRAVNRMGGLPLFLRACLCLLFLAAALSPACASRVMKIPSATVAAIRKDPSAFQGKVVQVSGQLVFVSDSAAFFHDESDVILMEGKLGPLRKESRRPAGNAVSATGLKMTVKVLLKGSGVPYLFLVFAQSSLLPGEVSPAPSQSPPPSGPSVSVTGIVRHVGNVPFDFLLLEGDDGKKYRLQGELARKLAQETGYGKVTVTGILSPASGVVKEAIVVTKYRLIQDL